MKNRVISLVLAGFVLLLMISFQSTSHDFEIPEGWPVPTYDFAQNPLTDAQARLGRQLFYDDVLSSDSTINCSSCHLQYTAFTHIDHDLSHGVKNRIGIRNSPALMNLAWSTSFMWDGSVHHLDMQALAPITDSTEMDNDFSALIEKMQASDKYQLLFRNAYGDTKVTGERFLKSLSQFLLTLVSANSKYDKVMRKEAEFTEQEANGYQTFKTNCATCHQEPLFTNYAFENNGLPVDTTLNDFGRMRVTGQSKDSLKFKVPTLRNIEFSYPYMHDGRFKKLHEVLDHYTKGIQESPTLATPLQSPIVLTANEKVDLVAFLLTLTDREFLFNPKHSFIRD